MAFGGNGKGIQTDINVTPLVDVVLVLLIIFMVMTPMLERGKPVQLPKAKARDDSKSADALIVSVTKERLIWLETKPVTRASLRDEIALAVRADAQRKILIKADESLSVGDIQPLMAEANAAGAKSVALAVEAKKP